MKRSVHHKPHWVSPHWRSYSRTPRIWGILSVNLCSFSKSALLLTPASVCTLRCINAQRDTNTSPRQEDVELENAVLEQGRGSWPHSSPGTHYGSVNRVQVVGDWFPRPGHGALQWWQLHNPHDSANICGRRARLGKSSARHQHREICFADPAGKHCWEFEGNFCLSSDVHPTGYKHVGDVPVSQAPQGELLRAGQQNCVPHSFSKEQHMCVTRLD